MHWKRKLKMLISDCFLVLVLWLSQSLEHIMDKTTHRKLELSHEYTTRIQKKKKKLTVCKPHQSLIWPRAHNCETFGIGFTAAHHHQAQRFIGSLTPCRPLISIFSEFACDSSCGTNVARHSATTTRTMRRTGLANMSGGNAGTQRRVHAPIVMEATWGWFNCVLVLGMFTVVAA